MDTRIMVWLITWAVFFIFFEILLVIKKDNFFRKFVDENMFECVEVWDFIGLNLLLLFATLLASGLVGILITLLIEEFIKSMKVIGVLLLIAVGSIILYKIKKGLFKLYERRFRDAETIVYSTKEKGAEIYRYDNNDKIVPKRVRVGVERDGRITLDKGILEDY